MAVIGPQQLYALTQKYFGDLGQEVVDTMYQIALRESGGNADAYNGQGLDNSHGIWQINTHPEANPDLAGFNLNDPEQNAQAARIVYDRQGPTAWSTYGGGMNEPMSTYQARPSGGGGTANALDSTTLLSGLVSAMPNPNDPKYKDVNKDGKLINDYMTDLADWSDVYDSVVKAVVQQNQLDAGITTMQDGTIIRQADFDRLDPQAQAQVQAWQAQQKQTLDQQWANIYNTLGLTEFQTRQDAIQGENQQRSQSFQNRLDEFGQRLNLDQMNQDTATKQVSRQLAGMSESRQRAQQIGDALQAAQGWATSNGQTSFTPGDFGAAMSTIAQFGGIGANVPFLKFTGTRTVDPAALLAQQDQALGVTGQLPQIPQLLTQPGQIPPAPNLMSVPTQTPQLLYPQQPVTAPISQATQPSRTLSEILGMPNF